MPVSEHHLQHTHTHLVNCAQVPRFVFLFKYMYVPFTVFTTECSTVSSRTDPEVGKTTTEEKFQKLKSQTLLGLVSKTFIHSVKEQV